MKKTSLPSKKDILQYIKDAPYPVGKRELCKHFSIKGAARLELKEILRSLRQNGQLEKDKGRRKLTGGARSAPARQMDDRRLMGIFHEGTTHHTVTSTDKKNRVRYQILNEHREGAKDGELVEVALAGRADGRSAKVIKTLGDPLAPKSISLIALHEHDIPIDFSESCLEEVKEIKAITSLKGLEDLRDLPLVTIDPEDARDHDDALYAEKHGDTWIVWVAIADVSAYLKAGTSLDSDAKERGNSCYFPDRVVPMLPEKLSADLCSLRANVDRPCLAVKMTFDADGQKIDHVFVRGMMRSHASLSYHDAQAIADGTKDSDLPIKDLFAAYACVKKARDERAPLELDIPERRVILDSEGQVVSINLRERFDAHKLVEEFMIQANVCAAETLESQKKPAMYRVHEQPTPEKLDALREILKATAIKLRKSAQIFPKQLNAVLKKAKDTPQEEMINISVLRAQTQAYYSPENLGHFGLNLARYVHFTSPIRRYADVLVHRALTDSLSQSDTQSIAKTAAHISQTERRAMMAERDTTDRYLALFMKDHIGVKFDVVINGVNGAGLFVKTKVEGAEGFIPVSTLGKEYFIYDKEQQALIGERTKVKLVNGLKAKAVLREVTPMAGGLLFELLSVESAKTQALIPFKPVPKKSGRNRKSSRR